MASKAVVDAVMARLDDEWTETDYFGSNDGGETPDNAASYLLVQFPVATTSRMPVNQRFYREEGGFRIVINGASGTGSDQILTWADQIAALFRDQKFGGIETQVPSSPFLDDDNENGNYFSAAIVVPYTYNFTG